MTERDSQEPALREVSKAEPWALVAEARATFGTLAAKQMAERLGVVREGGRDTALVDFLIPADQLNRGPYPDLRPFWEAGE